MQLTQRACALGHPCHGELTPRAAPASPGEEAEEETAAVSSAEMDSIPIPAKRGPHLLLVHYS